MSKQSINLSQKETKARYQSQFYLFECFSVIALTGASLIFLLVFLKVVRLSRDRFRPSMA